MGEVEVGWNIRVDGLTEEEETELKERVKCAVLLVLPARVGPDKIVVIRAPKAGVEQEA